MCYLHTGKFIKITIYGKFNYNAFGFAVSTLYLIQTKTILIEIFLIYLNKKSANVLHQLREMEKLLLFLLCSLKRVHTYSYNDDFTFCFKKEFSFIEVELKDLIFQQN